MSSVLIYVIVGVCILAIVIVVTILVYQYSKSKRQPQVQQETQQEAPKAQTTMPKLTAVQQEVFSQNAPHPVTPTPIATPTPTIITKPYTPPTPAMAEYYNILKAAFDSLAKDETKILKTLNSEEFALSKNVKQFLTDNPHIIPFVKWSVYENGDYKNNLNDKQIEEVRGALDYWKKFIVGNDGQKTSASVLLSSSGVRQFYLNNKTTFDFDKCIKSNACT